jgi:hypothetical protein
MSGLISARLGRRGRRLALVGCSALAVALAVEHVCIDKE